MEHRSSNHEPLNAPLHGPSQDPSQFDEPSEPAKNLEASRSSLAVMPLVLAVAFGATVFGMVLAGGLNLSPLALGSPQTEGSNEMVPAVDGARGALDAQASITTFADLADAILPSVVLVQATTFETESPRRGLPFDLPFRRPGREPGEDPREDRSDGAGSGFVVSADGWIVTNNHVIDGASEVVVTLQEEEYEAEVRGVDPSTDLAVLKVDLDRELPFLRLGNSEELRVGEWVMAAGNPLRQISSVTVGIVSGKGRTIGITDASFENFIQTDAAINRGNSGGPLVNVRGEVIGIATAMNFGAENIGFAVPVDTLKDILPQLKEDGRVRRGYLGVFIENLDEDDAEAFGLDSGTSGAIVTNVSPDTPAAKAGLEHGDIIVAVDGREVDETRDLIQYVSRKPVGTTVTLDLFRNGEQIERKVKLEERPDPNQIAQLPEDEEEEDSSLEWLGVDYETVGGDTRQMFRLPRDARGVVVTDVTARSPLWEERVQPGMVISEVNGTPIDDADDFEAAVAEVESGGFVRLYVSNYGQGGQARHFFSVVKAP